MQQLYVIKNLKIFCMSYVLLLPEADLEYEKVQTIA